MFSPGWRASIRQRSVLVFFATGLLLGGALSGGALWLLSGLSEPLPALARALAIVGVAVLGLLREFELVRLPLPQNTRQIEQDVLRRRPRLGPMQFGFELGTGVRTYVSSTAPYVVALALVLSHPGLPLALAAGLGFGLGRALTAAAQLWSRSADWNARVATRLGGVTKITAITLLTALTLAAISA